MLKGMPATIHVIMHVKKILLASGSHLTRVAQSLSLIHFPKIFKYDLKTMTSDAWIMLQDKVKYMYNCICIYVVKKMYMYIKIMNSLNFKH